MNERRSTQHGSSALVLGCLVALIASVAIAAAPIDRIELSDDLDVIHALGPDGALVLSYTIEDWRAWASQHLDAALGAPVMIGDVALEVSTFQAFGYADLTPDGRQLLVVATAYAMLTTASVFTVLDLDVGALDVVAKPAFGDVGELAWSPDGRYLAYTLGSARAYGDGLHVDDVHDGRRVLALDAHEALGGEVGASLGAVVDAYGWFPTFRDLAWSGDGVLAFASHDPALGEEEGVLRWAFDVTTQDLRLLDADAQ